MRESTRGLFRKHGWRVDRAIHNYVYFTYYYPYVKAMYHLVRVMSQYLFWFKPLNLVLRAALSRYHSKVLSFGDARKIFTLNEDLRAVSDRNRMIIPFRYAYKILFQEADCIAVMDCPCKKALGGEEWSINSCIGVGKGIASFWLDHGKKYHARKVTQEEALELIRSFRKRGYVTQAFFKVATGGSTGVICNCHPDTCASMKVNAFVRRFDKGLFMNARSGYSVMHDPEKCRACGTCIEICPADVIELHGTVRVYARDTCLGCELCVEHCPGGALSLYRDEKKPVPLDIDMVKREYADTD